MPNRIQNLQLRIKNLGVFIWNKKLISNSELIIPGSSGFTLIELLVTISIISILATVSLVGFQVVSKNGRDSKRQSDLKLIQSAIEQYNADQLNYPTPNSTVGAPCVNGQLQLGCPLKSPLGDRTYLNLVPNDPLYLSSSGTPKYSYSSFASGGGVCDNSTTQCKTYCLYAILENASSNSPLTSICTAFPSGGYNFLVTPP